MFCCEHMVSVEYVTVLMTSQHQHKVRELKEQVEESERKRQALEQQVQTASVGREDSVSSCHG